VRREKTTTQDRPEAAPRPLLVIDPNAVILADDLRSMLRLKASTLRREIREGRLRVCKRAGRYFFLGQQVLAWLKGGELPVRCPASAQADAA
jgi:hypothetical protein